MGYSTQKMHVENPYLTPARAIENCQANTLPGAQATAVAAEAEAFTHSHQGEKRL